LAALVALAVVEIPDSDRSLKFPPEVREDGETAFRPNKKRMRQRYVGAKPFVSSADYTDSADSENHMGRKR
jgi:hypothetical protein